MNIFSNKELCDAQMEDIVSNTRDHLIRSHYEELEETLLCCLAAGVSSDCIQLEYVQPNSIDYRMSTPVMMTTNIHFKYKL